MEAAPRFELGIRVLQTPALPLGHAAVTAKSQTNIIDGLVIPGKQINKMICKY